MNCIADPHRKTNDGEGERLCVLCDLGETNIRLPLNVEFRL
jgi:hypothetical protein